MSGRGPMSAGLAHPAAPRTHRLAHRTLIALPLRTPCVPHHTLPLCAAPHAHCLAHHMLIALFAAPHAHRLAHRTLIALCAAPHAHRPSHRALIALCAAPHAHRLAHHTHCLVCRTARSSPCSPHTHRLVCLEYLEIDHRAWTGPEVKVVEAIIGRDPRNRLKTRVLENRFPIALNH